MVKIRQLRVEKDAEKLEPSCTAGGNVWKLKTLEKFGCFSKVKHGITIDAAILLLGTYLRKLKVYFHPKTWIQTYTVALLIAKTVNNSKCLIADEWIK